MKTLILDAGYDSMSDYFRINRSKVKNCTSLCLYKKTKKRGIIYKIIQGIGVYFFSPILFLIYGSWKYNIDKFDIFILTSRRSSKYAIKFISNYCKKNNKRIIVWYWNIISNEEISPAWCKKIGVETWTFDDGDAKKYNLYYNNTYYFNLKIKPSISKYDIFYVGVEKKGRMSIINKIKKVCLENDLIANINIVKNPNYKSNDKIKYVDNMDYEMVLENISKSKCILDINNQNQMGLTLRPLEALFFKKKLITNNFNIKNMDFYNPSNIFIIGVDSFDNIINFIKMPYIDIDKQIINKYTFDSWLKRIIKKEEDRSLR